MATWTDVQPLNFYLKLNRYNLHTHKIMADVLHQTQQEPLDFGNHVQKNIV